MEKSTKLRILITGASGLLGYHARAAILAENCASDFKGVPCKYELVESPRLTTETLDEWCDLVLTADVVLHLAGVNRAEPDEVEFGNPAIAELLISAISASGSQVHIVYANSTHAGTDSPYGRGKEKANEILQVWSNTSSSSYTNVILPHIFGENAKPNYNNVTGTLCHQIVCGEDPVIHDGAQVELVHAGAAIDFMLAAVSNGLVGLQRIAGRRIPVSDLYKVLLDFRACYKSNTYPDLSDSFTASLFNTYRTVEYSSMFPRKLKLNSDERGDLFEAVKGGGGGQTFISWTKPGVERGNHFHRNKVERFLVLSGTAEIRVRALFGDRIDTYSVTGSNPAYVDMPTLHTHSIVNTGSQPLLTLFWTHEIFDPNNPDTFAHPVIQQQSRIELKQ